MLFLPFSNKQDEFLTPIPAAIYATFTPSNRVPAPSQLTRLVKLAYPNRHERGVEWGGHCVMFAFGEEEEFLHYGEQVPECFAYVVVLTVVVVYGYVN